jgi:hypothetical protein
VVAAVLLAAFARDGGDVIKTRTAQSPAGAEPVPDYGELRTEMALSDRDILVTKHGWNAFYDTQRIGVLTPRESP